MNVIISVNDKFVDAVETMLLSLRNHYEGEIVVYLLNRSLRAEEVAKMAAFLKDKCGIELVPIAIGETIFDEFPLALPERFSVEIFYRLMAPYLLDETVKRALWLDADIIVKGDLETFYHMDLGGKSLAVCRDECEDYPEKIKELRHRLDLPDSHTYFNSGVLLMDLQKIRTRYSLEEVLSTCERLKDRLYMSDQDILNVLFQNDVCYVDAKEYNISPGYDRKLFLNEYANVKVIHFYSIPKPWKLFTGIDPKLDYWQVQKQRGRQVQYYIAAGVRILRLDYFFRICWRVVYKIRRMV